jgi:hypothetical protein
MRAIVIFIILILALILFAPPVHAEDFFNLDEVSIGYKKFDGGGRDPLFFSAPMKEQLDLRVNTTLFYWLGFDSTVHSMTNTDQFHVVGLNTRLYVRLSKYVEVGREHFSRHILDSSLPGQRFPVYDCWTINIYLLRQERRKESLF